MLKNSVGLWGSWLVLLVAVSIAVLALMSLYKSAYVANVPSVEAKPTWESWNTLRSNKKSTPRLTPVVTEPRTASTNPFVGEKFYIEPTSPAKLQADAWRASRPDDAKQMDKIANQPYVRWIVSTHDREYVDSVVSAIHADGSLPVLVTYATEYSSLTPEQYKAWIRMIADTIGNRKAIIIHEPDGLARNSIYPPAEQQTRMELFNYSVDILKSKPNIYVYLDAGNAGWWPAENMATLLHEGGIARADGFALNVSNFHYTSDTIEYGREISSRVGGKHFVIDTGRNGNGPHPNWRDPESSYSWCNPPGRALGERPTTNTADPLVDAYFWIKPPGESDEQCNGGPPAGAWWPEYALELAQRAAY